jgi:hypothetical protein
MFRVSSVPIIRSYQLYTWQLVCFMQVMWPLPRRVRLEQSVQLITTDDEHRRCSKHVDFRDKINFGYLMHLVYLYEDVCFDYIYNFCLKHFSYSEELSETGSKCVFVIT